jgi:endonuclease-3
MEPMDELVSCILTQHTTDAVAFPTFDEMKKEFSSWQEVVDAGPERLARAIRRVGLANQKARNIIACLNEIHARQGAYDIEHLRAMPMLEGRRWLTSLPGVGPKTASIVLSFSFGKDAIPVDTHVFRVSRRLGLIPEKSSETKAHDLLLESVPPELAYRFHVALIRHGRTLCKAQRPHCGECPLASRCPWFLRTGARLMGRPR